MRSEMKQFNRKTNLHFQHCYFSIFISVTFSNAFDIQKNGWKYTTFKRTKFLEFQNFRIFLETFVQKWLWKRNGFTLYAKNKHHFRNFSHVYFEYESKLSVGFPLYVTRSLPMLLSFQCFPVSCSISIKENMGSKWIKVFRETDDFPEVCRNFKRNYRTEFRTLSDI